MPESNLEAMQTVSAAYPTRESCPHQNFAFDPLPPTLEIRHTKAQDFAPGPVTMVCQNTSFGADCETIEGEAFTPTAKTFKRYRGKCRLLETIHCEIAPKVKAVRDAREAIFRGKEDKQVHEEAQALAELASLVPSLA